MSDRKVLEPELHSLDAEKGFLSCLLHSRDALDDAAKNVATDVLYHQTTRPLYEVLLEFRERDLPVEHAAISDYLQKRGLFERVGGPSTLGELVDMLPGPTQYAYYKQTIKEDKAKRDIARFARDLETRIKSHPDDLGSFLEGALSRLGNLAENLAHGSAASAKEAKRAASIHADLDARRIRLESPPPSPTATYMLCEQQICTAGNLTVFAAQVKVGKTACIGGLIASSFAADDGNDLADCLGFSAAPTNGKAVIVFDSEQSRYDAWRLIDRSLRRIGLNEQPDNLRAYSLLDVDTSSRVASLWAEAERAAKECGGIHSIIIDGVADLCIDPNDPKEAFPLVEELVRLGVRHECPLILVLHENPAQAGQASGKTRGHLGSQLERKAESNLRIIKGEDGVSTLFTERSRSASIPKAHGVCFAWSDERGMHVTVDSPGKADKAAAKREEQQPVVDAAFEGHVGAISWGDLHKCLMERCRMTAGTAERRIREWKSMGLVSAASRGGGYVKC